MNSTTEPKKCLRYGCDRKRNRLGLLCTNCKAELKSRKANKEKRRL